ncbi:hypothetical protein DS885_03760 [Psychromonas sp. B3M02]|uniref:DUF3438 family protein n=1 Tax=Psychromonas sp. B3M02 TaxID=2267226 RepID=UPI000DEAD631|nr:DUF3438 family protein [Psychromonas sp. B3M02]RBW47272.1 hypothetical protein DS885_03760 [Psychromonas sp. B3M02]
MKNFWIIILLFTSTYLSAEEKHQTAIDDVYYTSLPVDIIISTAKESVIYFPNQVRVKDDFGGYIDVLPTDNVVIIKALTDFQSRRVLFQDLVTEKIYIFNVSSNNSNSPRSVRIITPSEKSKGENPLSKIPEGGAYIALTQHASVSLYYPERYKPTSKEIRNIKIKKGDASYFVTFNALTKIVSAWKGYGYFVTAIEVTNLDEKELVIDPRYHFRGDWLFLTAQHSWIGKRSDIENNVTTIYVISSRPFWESLL